MHPRRRHIFLLLMALLLAAQPFLATGGWAEAEMRCAGAARSSAPCAQVGMSAGLTGPQAYPALMACCRMGSGCARMGGKIALTESRRAALSAPHCLVTLRSSASSGSLVVPGRSRWTQADAPTLAPPSAAPAVFGASPVLPAWALSPALSPHAQPSSHGLRAPPAA